MTKPTVKLSEAHEAALQRCASMFRARIDHRIGIDLEDDGLVRWHPGSGYEITESGRAALKLERDCPGSLHDGGQP